MGQGASEQMVGYCDSPPGNEQYFPVLLIQMLFIFQTGTQSRKENMVSLRAKVMERQGGRLRLDPSVEGPCGAHSAGAGSRRSEVSLARTSDRTRRYRRPLEAQGYSRPDQTKFF